MQREREKKERAAARRERRQEKSTEKEETSISDLPEGQELTADQLMKAVEAVHRDYENGVIDLDQFEEARQALLARVKVD